MKLFVIVVYAFFITDCVPSKILFGEVTTLLKLSDTFPSLNTTNIIAVLENLLEPNTFFLSANRTILLAQWQRADRPSLEIIAGSLTKRGYREGTDALFGFVIDIIQTDDRLIVTDAPNHCLRIIRPLTTTPTQWETSTFTGKCKFLGSSDGNLDVARFNYPMGLIKQNKYLFIADHGNKKLRQLDMVSGEVTTAHQSETHGPLSMVLSGTENNFFFVAYHGIIQTNKGKEKWLVGWGKKTTQQEKAPFSTAGFGDPQYVTWLNDDILLVLDHATRSVKVVDLVKQEVDVLCPVRGSRPVDGDVNSCLLFNPLSLLVTNNTILIGDNNRIRSLEFQIADELSEITTLHTTKRIETTTTLNETEMCEKPPSIPNAVYKVSKNHTEGSAVYYSCTDGYTEDGDSNSALICMFVNGQPHWIGQRLKCRLTPVSVLACVLASICVCLIIATAVTAVKLRTTNKLLEEAVAKQTQVAMTTTKFTTGGSEAGCSNRTFNSDRESFKNSTPSISIVPNVIKLTPKNRNIPQPAPRLTKQTKVYCNNYVQQQ